jgi:hypothetical protein
MDIEDLHFNKIIVIQSLKLKTQVDNTGEHLYNDIIKIRAFQNEKEFGSAFYSINCKEDLEDLFKDILEAVKMRELVPVIHFEIHGSEEGLHLKNTEFVPWSAIVDFLSEINSVTKNNLLVTFATCFSSYILNYIDINKKCPFWSFVSTHTPIRNEDIAISYTQFYDILLTDRNFDKAVEALNQHNPNTATGLKFLSSETILTLLIKEVENNRFNNPTARKELEDEAVEMFLKKKPDQDPEMARQIIRFFHRNRSIFYNNVRNDFLFKKDN